MKFENHKKLIAISDLTDLVKNYAVQNRFKGEKRAGPVEAIKCIINEFKDNPITFKKGDWFMTGSVIQPFKVNKGDKLKVDFRSLGKINLDFI